MSASASWPWADGPLVVEACEGGALWRVRLATPKANIVDLEKIELFCELFERAARERGLKAVIIEGEGPHFSFGASVAEHLPGSFETMIPSFHRMFERILDASVTTLVAVRGQCLGGALELAAFCNRVFAAPGARLGQPEIVLGVLAPVASVILAERCGRGAAEDLCLSGRSLAAEEALRIGLVDEIAEDPVDAALGYARKYLLPRSASSLRLAVRALRLGFAERYRRDIAGVEKLYLEELMATKDAQEGLRSFIEKREPAWSDS